MTLEMTVETEVSYFYFLGEYEESKNFEIFRRYNRLKGMIKRTVMYTRLEILPDVTHALGTGSLILMTAPSIRKQLGMLYASVSMR